MSGEKDLFTSLELHDIPKETIVFGDNSKGGMVGLDKIELSQMTTLFQMFILVETLGYNLLSISQFCAIGYNCLFTNEGVTIFRSEDSSIAFTGQLLRVA
jgi:hypothetical protein